MDHTPQRTKFFWKYPKNAKNLTEKCSFVLTYDTEQHDRPTAGQTSSRTDQQDRPTEGL